MEHTKCYWSHSRPLVLERLEPTAEEIEQFYLAGIDDDVAQGFIYAPPQDANPTVPKKAKKRKLRSTAHVDKLPKKVKETLVEKETVKKSLPVKKTTRSQKSSTIKKRTRLQMADDDEPRLQMADDDEPMFSPRRRSPPRRPSPSPQPKQQELTKYSKTQKAIRLLRQEIKFLQREIPSMVKKAVEKAVDQAVEREFHTLFDKLRDAINAQVEEQDVDGNAQEPLHQSESRQVAKDTDVASKDTDVAAALLPKDLAAATSIGTTAATSVGNMELLTAMSVAAKDTDVSATLVPATDVSATTDDRTGDGQNQDQVNHENMLSSVPTSDADRPFRSRQLSRYLKSPYTVVRYGESRTKRSKISKNFFQNKKAGKYSRRYIGTLTNADAKFFNDFAREDFQLEKIHIDAWMVYLTKKIMKKGNPECALVDSYFFIYIENLWKNWDPDSEPDPSQASKIPEELMNYVWGLNPEWDIEWSNVRHVLAVCLMARSHWILAHINLEEWTIENDSLAHKTPKIPAIVWPASRT
ncbi:hypothetical protein Dimus_011392 [Dionaea muscipula]